MTLLLFEGAAASTLTPAPARTPIGLQTIRAWPRRTDFSELTDREWEELLLLYAAMWAYLNPN